MWPHKAVFYAAMGGGGHFHPAGPIQAPEDIAIRAKEGYPVAGMALAPLMHGACWWFACIQLLAGCKLVLNPNRSLVGEQVWDIAERERVNSVTIVGDAMARPLAEALEAHPGRWPLQRLAMIVSGGAPLSAHLQARLSAQLPTTRVMTSLGKIGRAHV